MSDLINLDLNQNDLEMLADSKGFQEFVKEAILTMPKAVKFIENVVRKMQGEVIQSRGVDE